MRNAKAEMRKPHGIYKFKPDIPPPTSLRSVLTWYLSNCQHSTLMLGVCHFCNSDFNLNHLHAQRGS
jgi:hypothetical protein